MKHHVIFLSILYQTNEESSANRLTVLVLVRTTTFLYRYNLPQYHLNDTFQFSATSINTTFAGLARCLELPTQTLHKRGVKKNEIKWNTI
jgi:hypothetical protein